MTQSASSFGHSRLGSFGLDPKLTYLNHGGYGATPNLVLRQQDKWRQEIEADPTGFFAFRYPKLIREAAEAVAGFLGGTGQDWAFTENATAGINAVVASWDLRPGDEILTNNHIYGAVRNTLQHYAGRASASIREVAIPFPYPGNAAFLDMIRAAITPRTRFLVVDHISSSPATLFPVADLAALCLARDIRILVDGAHVPGQMLVDVPTLGADWYVANLHKWAFVPRACGVLYASAPHRAHLHPQTISHYWGQGFPAEFDWVGTRDVSGWLAAPGGFDFWRDSGGVDLIDRNRQLVRDAAKIITDSWSTVTAAPSENCVAMVAVRIPHDGSFDQDTATRLFQHLWHEHRIVAPVKSLNGQLYIRIAAQIYNELEDYRSLALLLPDLIHELAAYEA